MPVMPVMPVISRSRRALAPLLALLVALGLAAAVPAVSYADTARPVAPAVSLAGPATASTYGTTATLTLTVRRGAPRQKATLQRKDGATWTDVKTKPLPRTGTVKKLAWKVKVTWVGKRLYRVRLARAAGVKAALTRKVAVTGLTTTWRVSDGGDNANTDDSAESASVSADGRYVAFASSEDYGFDPTGSNLWWQVYLWDRDTDEITLVSRADNGQTASGPSRHPVISADGRYVAFQTSARLSLDDENFGDIDIYRWDRLDGTFDLVSTPPNTDAGDYAERPAISADGSVVAFESDVEPVGVTATTERQAYVWKEADGSVTHASRAVGGAPADDRVGQVAVSADGSTVAFRTYATNLAGGPYTDTNGDYDVYLWRDALGPAEPLTLVSTDTSGTDASSGWSDAPSVSGNGRYVAFDSTATDIVAGDDGDRDIFLWDAENPTATVRVTESDAQHTLASITPDASRIAYLDGPKDVVVWTRATGARRLVTAAAGGGPIDAAVGDLQLSADGRWVVFDTAATGLLPTPDADAVVDVFLRGPLP